MLKGCFRTFQLKVVGLAVLCLVSEPHAATKIEGGTVVVVAYSEEKVILAADSRGFDNVSGTHVDTVCKLAALGDQLIFGETGKSVFKTATYEWSGMSEARQIAESISLRSRPNRTEGVATQWGSIMQSHVTAIPPTSIAHLGPNGEVSLGLFVGIEGQKMEIVLVTVYAKGYRPFRTQRFIPDEDRTKYFAIGEGYIVDEFVKAKTQRSAAENNRWNKTKMPPDEFDRFKAKRLVELTIKFVKPEDRQYVGGPVDVVELDRDGRIRTIAEKRNCQ